MKNKHRSGESNTKLLSDFRWGWLLAVLGGIGLFASLVLSYEKYAVAVDPSHVPSCSISPIVDCGSVLASSTDTLLLGVPNAFFGTAAFAALTTIGVLILAGAKPSDWFWKLFYGGVIFGLGTVVFFITQSLYVIGSLCLYCMTTWGVIIPLFWYSTVYFSEKKLLRVPGPLKKFWPKLKANHLGVVVAAYLLVFGLILFRFRDYFESVWL